jgi:hypothetical protein
MTRGRESERWVVAASYGAAYEADIAAAKVDAAGIPVRVRGNDLVGIFGPNFGGFTARGIDVLVPESLAADARLLLRDRGEGGA